MPARGAVLLGFVCASMCTAKQLPDVQIAAHLQPTCSLTCLWALGALRSVELVCLRYWHAVSYQAAGRRRAGPGRPRVLPRRCRHSRVGHAGDQAHMSGGFAALFAPMAAATVGRYTAPKGRSWPGAHFVCAAGGVVTGKGRRLIWLHCYQCIPCVHRVALITALYRLDGTAISAIYQVDVSAMSDQNPPCM
jgi:hypothetical protein